jgi:serine protease Do
MLQDMYFQYRGACMMLFQREGEEVSFRGTAFLVHPEGYFLTAGHLITGSHDLMVVPADETEDFTPIRTETVAPIPVEVRQLDRERDLALLKFTEEIDISMPDHVIGTSENVAVGNSVACLGFPFGYYHIYNQLIKKAVICSKISSGNETRIFLFDSLVHDGNRGGPLINLYDGRIIGVVGGRFELQEILSRQLGKASDVPIKTDVSYAVSIEHALELMKKEGLHVI